MNDDFLTKLSYMHYIDNLPQNEIAKVLKISKSSVSRALQTARDRGIVKIEINPAYERCYKLEKILLDQYHISRAIVIPSYSEKDENLLKDLGSAGANFLKENVKKGMTVSFSMGNTLSEVANCLEVEEKIECNIVPMSGGLGQVSPELHSNDICRRIAENIGGVAYPLYAPAIVSNESLKNGIMEDPMIQKVFEMAVNSDYTVVSVGNVSNSTFLDLGIISKEESNRLKEAGAIGDIGTHFFNSEGEILDVPLHNRVVGPNFKLLSQNSQVVLIAGTLIKKEVIKSALTGKWVDILITDEKVAEFLVKQ